MGTGSQGDLSSTGQVNITCPTSLSSLVLVIIMNYHYVVWFMLRFLIITFRDAMMLEQQLHHLFTHR